MEAQKVPSNSAQSNIKQLVRTTDKQFAKMVAAKVLRGSSDVLKSYVDLKDDPWQLPTNHSQHF